MQSSAPCGGEHDPAWRPFRTTQEETKGLQDQKTTLFIFEPDNPPTIDFAATAYARRADLHRLVSQLASQLRMPMVLPVVLPVVLLMKGASTSEAAAAGQFVVLLEWAATDPVHAWLRLVAAGTAALFRCCLGIT